MITKLKNIVLDILFPPLCLSCQNYLGNGKNDHSLCDKCRTNIIIHTTLFCSICRSRLPENKKICHKESSYLLGAATTYDEPIKTLIHHFKYGYWTRLEKPLNTIFLSYLENLGAVRSSISHSFKKYIVVPIPLHKDRLKERGFNQATCFARAVALHYKLPIEQNLLFRVKETKPQVKLDWEKRKNNLEKAFTVSKPGRIEGKNIILIDDVYTSGATINEAVRTLRSSGAKKIIALVLAKTR